MAKKIVIKVSIENEKDKKNVLKAVAKLEGINEMSVDVEKGTLTILGEVDPVCIVTVLRKKCCRYVEIMTIGPPKPPEKKEEKKDPPKCPPCPKTCCPSPPCPSPCPPSCPPPCPQPCLPPCPRPCTGSPCTCDYGYDPRRCTII